MMHGEHNSPIFGGSQHLRSWCIYLLFMVFYIHQIMSNPKIRIHRAVWKELIGELYARGEGVRETGAFLLGDKSGNTISHFICYNDLDPHVSESGIIIFNGNGFIPLWEYCSAHKMKVLADVHTHPDEWTGQSTSDRKHPMIAQAGHIAF